ncbi:MAG: hypothetical protein P4M12_02435, partial [Gammaproteobacteria bacterium]|nr:hypothetical protein [Gammaproteobacteria bacterium]
YIVIPAEQIHKKHGSFWKLLTEVIVSSLALAAAPWAAPFLFTFAAGSLGAAVATGVTAGLLDAAMQGAACGVGLQDKFSISGVIETGVLGGFLAAAKGAAVANEARQAAATRTMLAMGKASVTSQLMEMSMGLRQKFDVKEVLTSMANGFANAKIEVPNTGQFAGRIVGNAVTTLTGTAITSLVYRQDPNLQYMAAQLLGSTIGTETGQMLAETTERKAEPETKLPKTQNRQAHVEELAHAELPDGNVDYGRHADAHQASQHEQNVKFKSDFFTNSNNQERFRNTMFGDGAYKPQPKGVMRSFVDAAKDDISNIKWAATHGNEVASAIKRNLNSNLEMYSSTHLFQARLNAQRNNFKQAVSDIYHDIHNGNYDSVGKGAEALATSQIPILKLLGVAKLAAVGKVSFFGSTGIKITERDAVLPKTRQALHEDLITKGYEFKGTSKYKGYTTYKNSDGRTITIKDTGEVIPTQRVWNSEKTMKYSERQDYNNNRLPDQSHTTGHFVEPLYGPFQIEPDSSTFFNK